MCVEGKNKKPTRAEQRVTALALPVGLSELQRKNRGNWSKTGQEFKNIVFGLVESATPSSTWWEKNVDGITSSYAQPPKETTKCHCLFFFFKSADNYDNKC